MPNGIGGELLWLCPSLDNAGTGTTTVNDQSIFGRNGTLTNMDASTDWVLDTSNGGVRALDLDGVNDYVAVTLPSLVTTWTFAGWFYFRTLAGVNSDPTLLNSNTTVYLAVGPSGRLQFFNGGWQNFTSATVATGAWYHLAFVKRSTTLAEAYIDGVSVGTVAANAGDMSGASQIGSRVDATSQGVDGRVDDVRIFGRALSSTEITALASKRGYTGQGTGGLGGEIGWWCPSLDNTGNGTTTLNDRSGFSNNGTLTNFALSGSTSNWVADTGNGGVRAIDLDGTNDWISIPAPAVIPTEVTVSCWIKLTAAPANFDAMFTAWGSSRGFILTMMSSSRARMYVRGSVSSYVSCDSTTILSQNNWTHIFGTVSTTNQNITVGVNGSQQASNTWSSTILYGTQGSATGQVGQYDGNGFGQFLIDDIRIYNRVLTSTELGLLASKRGYLVGGGGRLIGGRGLMGGGLIGNGRLIG